MSFANSARRFAQQVARERQALSPAIIQPYSGTQATGYTQEVFLSAVHAEREVTDNGFLVVEKATLRVQKTCRWLPVEGAEFVNTATSERFRCNRAVGEDSDFAADIVCEVVKIN